MGNTVIGAYQAGDSLIHRLDPRLKLVLSLVLMILVFFLSSPLSLGLFAIFVFALLILSEVNIKTIWLALRPIIFILSIIFLLNIFTVPGEIIWSWRFLSISREGLNSAILVSVRLILLTFQTSILISFTTSALLLADSIESLLRPLKRFNVPVDDFALMISIALRFIPTLSEEANKILKAQSARGANLDTGKFIDRVKGILSILVPLFVNSIKRADELAIALEARGYGTTENKTKYKPLVFERKDLYFALFSLAVVIAVIVLEVIF